MLDTFLLRIDEGDALNHVPKLLTPRKYTPVARKTISISAVGDVERAIVGTLWRGLSFEETARAFDVADLNTLFVPGTGALTMIRRLGVVDNTLHPKLLKDMLDWGKAVICGPHEGCPSCGYLGASYKNYEPCASGSGTKLNYECPICRNEWNFGCRETGVQNVH